MATCEGATGREGGGPRALRVRLPASGGAAAPPVEDAPPTGPRVSGPLRVPGAPACGDGGPLESPGSPGPASWMEPFLAMARTPQSRSWSLSSNLLAGALGQSTADEIAAAVDSMDPTPAQSPRLGAAFAWPSSVPGTAGARVAPLAIGHPTAGDSPGRAQARGGAQTVGGRGSPLAVGSGWPHAGALGSSILSQLAAEGRIPGPSRAAQQLGPGNHGTNGPPAQIFGFLDQDSGSTEPSLGPQLGTHDPRLAPGMPGFLEMGVEGIQISPSGSGGARGGNSPRPSVSLHPSPGAGLLSEALRASPSPGPHPHAEASAGNGGQAEDGRTQSHMRLPDGGIPARMVQLVTAHAALAAQVEPRPGQGAGPQRKRRRMSDPGELSPHGGDAGWHATGAGAGGAASAAGTGPVTGDRWADTIEGVLGTCPGAAMESTRAATDTTVTQGSAVPPAEAPRGLPGPTPHAGWPGAGVALSDSGAAGVSPNMSTMGLASCGASFQGHGWASAEGPGPSGQGMDFSSAAIGMTHAASAREAGHRRAASEQGQTHSAAAMASRAMHPMDFQGPMALGPGYQVPRLSDGHSGAAGTSRGPTLSTPSGAPFGGASGAAGPGDSGPSMDRRERNRLSARKSRERRQKYMEEQEVENERLAKELDQKLHVIASLEKNVVDLRYSLAILERLHRGGSGGATQGATATQGAGPGHPSGSPAHGTSPQAMGHASPPSFMHGMAAGQASWADGFQSHAAPYPASHACTSFAVGPGPGWAQPIMSEHSDWLTVQHCVGGTFAHGPANLGRGQAPHPAPPSATQSSRPADSNGGPGAMDGAQDSMQHDSQMQHESGHGGTGAGFGDGGAEAGGQGS